jgi:hypothetical protein
MVHIFKKQNEHFYRFYHIFTFKLRIAMHMDKQLAYLSTDKSINQ